MHRANGASVGRRSVLGGVGVAIGTALGGCLGGGRDAEPLPPPVLGDPGAAVTVAAYEDFSCPHCATYALDVLPELRSTYLDPGRVRYEHHDFPLPVDAWSWPVASAARAVQDGWGDAAFFDYAESCYRSQESYSQSRLGTLAEGVGADSVRVREAAAEETYRPTVEADRDAGRGRGVRSTPTVFVDDRMLVGPDYAALRDAIDAAR